MFRQIIKQIFRKIWFNQPTNSEQFYQRPGLTNKDFLNRLKLSSELAKKTVECCRKQLEKAYRVPANKFYPDDGFLDIINLSTPGWDMLVLVFALEEALDIDIDEKQFLIGLIKK